jgi:sugar transferase (PEP-CTERM/EpsH1 system associated)
MGDMLFLAHRLPYPPDRGDRIRSFHLLKALAKLGRVHLAAFADDAGDLVHLDALRPLFARSYVELRTRSMISSGVAALATRRPVSLAAFDSGAMRAAVAAMLAEEPIDTIVAFSSQMAQFVPARCNARFVMDFVDVDSAKFEAYADRKAFPMNRVHAREAALLAAYERRTAERADLSLFVSEAEARFFRQRSGLGPDRVAALENGIDLTFFHPDADFVAMSRESTPMILFTGQMDYPPNIEAVTAFATQSLPTIRLGAPSTRFAIVGRDPTAAVERLGRLPGVIVTGSVPDVRPWLAAADVVVAPLGMARGVQNKVLEAMAMARAVVASPDAFAGIEAEPGRDLIVAGPGEDAAAVLSLLRDAAKAAEIGQNARHRVEARYGWESRLAPLADMIGRQRGRVAA